jgi:seryl-tRNA synthetase
MTGISRRNFGMFRKLCGDDALQNVVIVTNMWGEVTAEVGNQREAELMSEDDFFKPVLEKGARMARHKDTVLSAEKIIRLILGNHPLPLRIQEELVKEHKNISETGAGEELDRVINAQIKRHQQEMRTLRDEMEQAMKDKDEEVRKALEDEMKGLQGKVEGLREGRKRLESDYKRRLSSLRDTIRDSEKEKATMREEIDKLSRIVNRPGVFSRIGSFFF